MIVFDIILGKRSRVASLGVIDGRGKEWKGSVSKSSMTMDWCWITPYTLLTMFPTHIYSINDLSDMTVIMVNPINETIRGGANSTSSSHALYFCCRPN